VRRGAVILLRIVPLPVYTVGAAAAARVSLRGVVSIHCLLFAAAAAAEHACFFPVLLSV